MTSMDPTDMTVLPGKAGKVEEGRTFTTDDAFDANPDHYVTPHSSTDAAIPRGTIDPVYEAKARVLNHAVRLRSLSST